MEVTYTQGFKIEIKNGLTKREYILLCERISCELNKHYGYKGEDKIKLTPECITEGGMRITGGPDNMYGDYDNKGKVYKSMRHHLGWQWIKKNTHEEWKESKDKLCSENTISETFLKAFDGAPVWTMDELNILKNCFESVGIVCKKMPKKKDLKEVWDVK